MKVTGNLDVYKTFNNMSKGPNKSTIADIKKRSSDKLDISSTAKLQSSQNSEVDFVKSRMNIASERAEKIADLKSRIESGNYNVSSSTVADAILNSKKV